MPLEWSISGASWAELADDLSDDDVDFSAPCGEKQGREKGKSIMGSRAVEPLGSETSSPNSSCHSTCGSTAEVLERDSLSHDSGAEEPQESEPPPSPTTPSAMTIPVCKVGGESENQQPATDCSSYQVQCVPIVMSPVAMWPSTSWPSLFMDTADQTTCALWPMELQQSDAAPGANQLGNCIVYDGYQGFSQPPDVWTDTLTVMMRNLPNKYTQEMLHEEIIEAGFSGLFDFMYLPIDPESNRNKGYAFINFVDPVYSWSFKCHYEGRRMARFNSDKFVTVVRATIQGYEANQARKRTLEGTLSQNGRASANPNSTADAEKPRRRGARRRSMIDESLEAQQQKKQAEAEQGESSAKVSETADQDEKTLTIEEKSKDDQPKHDNETASLVLEKKFCPFCGNRTKNDFVFCQFCGGVLP